MKTQLQEYLFSAYKNSKYRGGAWSTPHGNGKLSTLSGHYAPYDRGAYFPREILEILSISRFETNPPAESTERFIGRAKERRKNVEEVVTLAENCDCPVKLRVLYSLYFLRAVSSSLLLV